jgi:hypothetical protein
MRVFFISLITILVFIGCDKKLVDTKFCQNCDLKTDALTIIENKTGWLIFLSESNQYAIEVAHYNDPIIYLPCQIPSYFQPVEMASVEFSGKVLEDPYITGDIIKSTYYCIKLDTIHSITTK